MTVRIRVRAVFVVQPFRLLFNCPTSVSVEGATSWLRRSFESQCASLWSNPVKQIPQQQRKKSCREKYYSKGLIWTCLHASLSWAQLFWCAFKSTRLNRQTCPTLRHTQGVPSVDGLVMCCQALKHTDFMTERPKQKWKRKLMWGEVFSSNSYILDQCQQGETVNTLNENTWVFPQTIFFVTQNKMYIQEWKLQ